MIPTITATWPTWYYSAGMAICKFLNNTQLPLIETMATKNVGKLFSLHLIEIEGDTRPQLVAMTMDITNDSNREFLSIIDESSGANCGIVVASHNKLLQF